MFLSMIVLALVTLSDPDIKRENGRLVEQRQLEKGAASQGIALAKDFYYGASSKSICRFDTNWKFIEEKPIRVKGVNHVGAIHHHDGFIWAGLLHGPVNGKHDPKLDRGVIAKIRTRDLEIVKTWDISGDVTWIDPVCFDGTHLWVGDLSDLGIHRYKLADGKLVRDGILRYPKAMHFSQGIRVVGNRLYSIHTFATMDGLFEFEIPDTLDGSVNEPQRMWEITETRMHLEGFDFAPGRPNEIWHAQGSQVDRYELEGLPPTAEFQLRGYTLTVPDGFTVEVVAEEPLVKYPICADFDAEGRLYVSDSSGAKDWNRPQPKETRHRMLRLEDVDGDGRFDTRTVFAEFDMLAQGSMCLDGSVYVAAPPIIWKLTDADGDGVAEQREKWVETDQVTACVNDLRGPYLGPDGWIYWCKGAGATQTYQVDGKPWSTTARHIFRRHPNRQDVEQVMVGGMDNAIEVAFSRTGERFLTNTNIQFVGEPRKDGVLHSVYGGIYPKDISPVYDFPWSGPDMMPALSAWSALSPCGLARYDSGEFGQGYRDNLFSCLFSGHKVVRHVLEPEGATYQSREENFLTCDDVQFHPTDVLEDADGSLLVIETGGWYLHCCPSSTFYRPERHGAIYRVRRKGAHQIDDPHGRKLVWKNATADQLGSRLGDRRIAVRRRAVHELRQLGPAAVPALDRTITDLDSSSVDARSLAVWAAARIDSPAARAAVRHAVTDTDATVQHTALNCTSLWRDRKAVPQLIESLRHPSAQLRRSAAEALGRIGDHAAVPALLRALSQPTDRFLEHSLTFALIEIADPRGTRAGLSRDSVHTRRAALIALDQMQGGSIEADFVAAQLDCPDTKMQDTAWWILSRHARDWGSLVADHLRRHVASTTLTETGRQILASRLARVARTPELAEWIAAELTRQGVSLQTQILLLQAMDGAGGRWADNRWVEAMLDLLTGTVDATVVTHLVSTLDGLPPIRVKDATSRDLQHSLNTQLRKTGEADGLTDATRLVALTAIDSKSIGHVDDTLFSFLLSRIGPDQTLHLRTAAAEVLSRCELGKPQLLRLATTVKNLAPSELNRVLDVFRDASDDDVGLRLVAALATSSAVTTLNVFRLKRCLAGFGEGVREQTGPLFRRLELAQEEQLARALRITDLAATADPHRGLQVFRSNRAACSTCHKTAHVGGTFGPHLRGIGQRRSMRDLVESILFPSASIVQSYETHVVVTKDGLVASGVIRKDSPTELVIAAAPDQAVRIPRDAIDEIRRSDISSMPEGIDKTLTEQQLADLVAYLKSLQK